MPTFVFRNVHTGATVKATAHAMNAARDMTGYHDGSVWVPWECWQGGECLWHYTDAGDCLNGKRVNLDTAPVPMLRQLSAKWVERQSALGLKGKAADRAVFEFMTGAATALQAAGHAEAQHVVTCVAVILANVPFPCGTVAGWAMGKGDGAPANTCDGEG